jgi:hypothetical protein
MQTLSIAANDTSVFIHLEKSTITSSTVDEVNAYLRSSLAEEIAFVSDEEQQDIEATLAALTDEDKKLGKRFRVAL